LIVLLFFKNNYFLAFYFGLISLVLKHLFQLVYQTHLNLILISGSGVEAATGEAFG